MFIQKVRCCKFKQSFTKHHKRVLKIRRMTFFLMQNDSFWHRISPKTTHSDTYQTSITSTVSRKTHSVMMKHAPQQSPVYP